MHPTAWSALVFHGPEANRRTATYTARREVGVVLLVPLLVLLVACAGPSASGGPSATQSTVVPAATAVPSPDLTPFVGVWSRHGADLTVTPDGSFSLEWRTYRSCGQEAPPCDQIVNNLITDGGRAVGMVHAVGARSAVGQVRATNDPAFVPSGSFLADVTSYQLLTLRFPTTTVTLCGRSFATLAPAEVVQTRPCGG